MSFVPYLMWAAMTPSTAAMPDLRTMWAFAIAAGVSAAVHLLGRLWLRRTPVHGGPGAADSAATPIMDERDRAIDRRSVGAAYGVLMAGLIVVGCVMPFQKSGWSLVNAAVAAVVLAEGVRYGVAVWCYRRGTGSGGARG